MSQASQHRRRFKVLQVFLCIITLTLTACGIVQPEPTPTPTPTKTLTPTVTATITPTTTATFTPSPTPPPGLGVSRADIQEVYEDLDFNFTPPHDGIYGEEVVGEFQGVVKTLVFIDGPTENPSVAWVTVFYPLEPTREQLFQGLDHMAALLDSGMPDWEDRIDWLLVNLEALEIGKEESTTQDGRLVTVSFWPSLDDELVFMVKIEAQ